MMNLGGGLAPRVQGVDAAYLNRNVMAANPQRLVPHYSAPARCVAVHCWDKCWASATWAGDIS